MEKRPKKLLAQGRDAIRLKRYSLHTEQAYVIWIKRYMFFHDKRHGNGMGSVEIEALPTHPGVHQKVAASTKTRLSAPCCSSTATCSDNLSACPSRPIPSVDTPRQAAYYAPDTRVSGSRRLCDYPDWDAPDELVLAGKAPGERAVHVVGLDHVVVNTQDLEQPIHFYREVVGLEILRLKGFRAGQVGFV
jgi:catechol 2,3-dioxygenase-like lactoylglutathione lyase family enzyme